MVQENKPTTQIEGLIKSKGRAFERREKVSHEKNGRQSQNSLRFQNECSVWKQAETNEFDAAGRRSGEHDSQRKKKS